MILIAEEAMKAIKHRVDCHWPSFFWRCDVMKQMSLHSKDMVEFGENDNPFKPNILDVGLRI